MEVASCVIHSAALILTPIPPIRCLVAGDLASAPSLLGLGDVMPGTDRGFDREMMDTAMFEMEPTSRCLH